MTAASHEHVFERIRPDEMPEDELLRRTEQVGYLMAGVQRYYTDELGLVRIDPDAPPGSREDDDWRFGRLGDSGELSVRGLEYVVARRLERPHHGETAAPSRLLDGICGMVVLGKNRQCSTDIHTGTELVEFDVAKAERGRGLGKSLLSHTLEVVHPEDELRLYVAEPNNPAIDVYRSLGFSFTGEAVKYTDIFEQATGARMSHLPMAAKTATIRTATRLR
jgi:ribosomal protein S18 acetylase RimI-like enzyme